MAENKEQENQVEEKSQTSLYITAMIIGSGIMFVTAIAVTIVEIMGYRG